MHDAEQIIAEYPVVLYCSSKYHAPLILEKDSKCKQIALTQILNW